MLYFYTSLQRSVYKKELCPSHLEGIKYSEVFFMISLFHPTTFKAMFLMHASELSSICSKQVLFRQDLCAHYCWKEYLKSVFKEETTVGHLCQNWASSEPVSTGPPSAKERSNPIKPNISIWCLCFFFIGEKQHCNKCRFGRWRALLSCQVWAPQAEVFLQTRLQACPNTYYTCSNVVCSLVLVKFINVFSAQEKTSHANRQCERDTLSSWQK